MDIVSEFDVVVADNQAVVRRGIKEIIENQTDIAVMAGISSPEEALEYCKIHKPDLLIIDCFLFAEGAKFIKSIKELNHNTHVLVLTLADDPINIQIAMTEGATGYILKTANELALVEAVVQTLQGKTYLPTEMLGNFISAMNISKKNKNNFGLTFREIDILKEIGNGYSNKEIARNLDISVRTVETHRYNIRAKTNVTTNSQLVQIARYFEDA